MMRRLLESALSPLLNNFAVRTPRWRPMPSARRAMALVVAALTLTPATGQAQDVRRDPVWNGVVTGAGIGASLGVVLAATTDSVCTVKTCMALAAVAGGAIGLAVDKSRGRERIVEPGSLLDDPLWNGALIGAAAGSSAVVVDYVVRGCGPPDAPAPCGRLHILADALRGALFTAGVGALIDAAIPSRIDRTAEAEDGGARQRVAVAVRLRF